MEKIHPALSEICILQAYTSWLTYITWTQEEVEVKNLKKLPQIQILEFL